MSSFGSHGENESGKWMRDTFSRVIKLYRARGYWQCGRLRAIRNLWRKAFKWITESQTEKPSVDRYLHVVSGGSGASKVDDGDNGN